MPAPSPLPPQPAFAGGRQGVDGGRAYGFVAVEPFAAQITAGLSGRWFGEATAALAAAAPLAAATAPHRLSPWRAVVAAAATAAQPQRHLLPRLGR